MKILQCRSCRTYHDFGYTSTDYDGAENFLCWRCEPSRVPSIHEHIWAVISLNPDPDAAMQALRARLVRPVLQSQPLPLP